MPKDSTKEEPLSGLFGVNKPSGPTSMALVNQVKELVSSSPVFVEKSKLGNQGKKKRGRFAKGPVKIGQGGTLDPLADGVLGSVGSLNYIQITRTNHKVKSLV